MRDYERYMNRQRMSDTAMARLMKLETQRPKKTYRAPGWLKYAGLAACLCLAAGLVALPFLRGGQQRQAGPGLEELYFNQVAATPLTDQAIAGGMGLNELDAAQAAELFGSSPDDFPAFLEDLGLEQFDMEYYIVDMDTDPSNDDGGFRFLMRGDYVPQPRLDMVSSLYAINTVWLEIYEGHSYGGEDDWKELTPCEVNGHRVVAACDENSSYRAAAVFDLESGGKTYGVLYSVSSYGQEQGAASSQELVTKLVNRLADRGIFVPQNALVFNWVEAAPQNSCVPEGSDDQWVQDTGLLELLRSDGETLGWTDFYVSGHATSVGRDPESGWGTHYFRGTGSRGDGSAFEVDLMPDLTDFAAYVAQDVANWDALEKSVVNGHSVTAAIFFDQQSRMYYAAATFVVEDSVCDYGVFYSVRVKTEAEAKELVTKLVNRLTANGVFTEMYAMWVEMPALEYAQLTQIYTFVDSNVVQKGDTSRPLTREELESVCRAAAGTAGENYVWSGTAHFKADENLHAVVITGDKMDGTATVTVTIAQEEEVAFTRNLVEKDGRRTYFGAENQSKFSGFELVRCFWVDEWEHVRTQNAADTPNLFCYVQSKPAGETLYVEVRGHVGSGTLQENQDFTTQWFYQIDRDGLWFQTGNVNGQDIWKLPVTDTETQAEPAAADLAGTYTMTVAADSELDEMDALFLPAVILREDGSCQCAQDPASSHLCEGHYSCRDGRVTVTCKQHHYEFEVVDSDCLRFVAGDSDGWTRYFGPEVTDGAVFRRDSGERDMNAWIAALEGEVAADLAGTHHPEPTHHVEETHHPELTHHAEESHHSSGHH